MKRLNAIIIDDDPVSLFRMRQILQRRAYDVHSYTNPVDTPQCQCKGHPCSLHPKCPDLIVSDYDMPVVNGAEFLESAMKKGCRCRHLAIITGKDLPEGDLIRLAKYGTRFFNKHLDLDDFYSWLDRIEAEIAEHPTAPH